MENTKKPWLSKTIWVNVLIALGALYPPVGSWMAAHPDAVVAGLGIINVGLRLVSKDKISLE